MKRLILIRHGKVSSEYAGRFIGTTDAPLGEEGREDVKRLSNLLQIPESTYCLSSPLLRATETADILFGKAESTLELKAELEVETKIKPKEKYDLLSDIQEINFGNWENKTYQEIDSKDPGNLNSLYKGDTGFVFPAGEGIAPFFDRLRNFLKQINENKFENIIAITHAGVIRGLICLLMNLEFKDFFSFQIDTAALTVLDIYEPIDEPTTSSNDNFRGSLKGLNLFTNVFGDKR